MSAPVVDLDYPPSWPQHLISEAMPLLSSIIEERAARLEFYRSGDRWSKSAPETPVTDAAHDLIKHEMVNLRIRVFHATRLLDFEEIRQEGMRPLDLNYQIGALRDALLQAGVVKSAAEFDEWIAHVDSGDYSLGGREGQVWFVPLRRLLHDGGCDKLFSHWGGEALRHLAEMASPRLINALQSLGSPAVVTASIPAFGCRRFGDDRLVPTMLGLMLERARLIEESTESWDVLIENAIPAEWIESVVPPDDPSLAA